MGMKFQPRMQDFAIGSGGGGLMPNSVTVSRRSHEWDRLVEKDLEKQAKAMPRPRTEIPGKKRTSGPIPLV